MTKSEFLIAPGYERVTGQRLTAERMTCLLEREEKRDWTGNEKTLCIVGARAEMIAQGDPDASSVPLPPALPEKQENRLHCGFCRHRLAAC